MQNCLRGNADLTLVRTIASSPDFDWHNLLRIAAKEGVSPLLFHALSGQEIAPSHVAFVLRDSYNYTARRNLLLMHECSSILSGLMEAGVDVVVLKGAALAETIYENIALRPMIDLDFLVRQDQVSKAAQTLTSSGYSKDGRTNLASSLEYEHQVQFSKPGIEEIDVDLHWGLLGWYYYIKAVPIDWLWRTARPANLAGSTALILGPEAQLLHLCAHTTIDHSREKHRLLRQMDVAELIRFYEDELDWELFLDTAVCSNLIYPIQRVLPWVAKRLDAPVPENVLQRCQNMQPSASERRTLHLRHFAGRSFVQRALSDLTSIRSWPERFRYLYTFVLKKLFAPPANLIDRYQIRHPILLPFFYIYWLVNGFADLILVVLRK